MSVLAPSSIPRHADAESAKRLVSGFRGRFRGGFRGGFSLVEMVVSLAVVSVLLAGMTSAVVLASRALPSNDGPAAATVQTAEALHQLRDDLRAATELLNRTDTSVTLHLPDRDGDGRPEVVTYAWSGDVTNTADPLTRAVNGNAAVTVLEGVQSFALTYTAADEASVFPGALNTSAEQLLSSYDTATPGSHILKQTDWIGAQIAPTLPTGSARWRITRALLSGARQGASTNTITFELRGWAGGEPGRTVWESIDLAESTMSIAFEWYDVLFSGGVTFDAGQTASLVLANHSAGDAGKWQYNDVGPTPRNAYNSADQGATWEPDDGDNNNHLLHYVYGTYESSGDDWTHTQPRVTAVDIALIHSGRADATHRLAVPLLNAPAAADRVLEADGAADPPTLDLDDDGNADWEVTNGDPAGTITDGVLALENEVKRVGLGSLLDQPFTIDLRLEDATDDGNPAKLEVKYDLDDGIAAKFKLYVDLAGSTQTVTLYTHNPDHEDIELHTATAEAGRIIDLKLVVDPERDTLAIVVDDQAPQSYTYLRGHDDDHGEIKLKPDGDGSVIQLDHLRLTVGGTVTPTPGAYPGS